MSILIKGMEMPTSCWECPMVGGYELSDEVKARYSTLHCRLLKCKTPSGVKPNDCPLVPIPPHCRLIDADALIKSLSLDEDDAENGASLLMAIFLEVLKAAPTIIEAEEGET